MKGKVIIISAPSGSGKSTIIRELMGRPELKLRFSVSATNRPPRGAEEDGVDYHFLSDSDFRRAIADNAFLEFEEVYPGRFYGTLRSEVDRVCTEGNNVVLDIDVNGGLRVKKQLGARALALFIQPPCIEELRRRLEGRATDSPDSIATRVERARYELSCAPSYDVCIVNDDLSTAVSETESAITDFLTKEA